jgi:hypothetical protein
LKFISKFLSLNCFDSETNKLYTMKKLFFGLIILIFSSCSVENDSLDDSKTTRIEEIKNEKNIAVQRVMYNLLSPDEKYQLWSRKIDNLTNDKSLNAEQINLLEEVKSKLNRNYFDNSYSDDNKEVFKVVYLKDFLKKAKAIFIDNFIYNNFYTINSSRVEFEDNSPNTSCACYKGTTFWACGVVSPYTCKTPADPCTTKTTGCGLWLQDECDGKCS